MNLEVELDELLLEPTRERLMKFFQTDRLGIERLIEEDGNSVYFSIVLPEINVFISVWDEPDDDPDYPGSLGFDTVYSIYNKDKKCIGNGQGPKFRVLYKLKRELIKHNYIKE